jgi:hypothetical protein
MAVFAARTSFAGHASLGAKAAHELRFALDHLVGADHIPMAGQIVDVSLVPAPKQRNTEGEKAAIKAGKSAREIWPNEPAKAAQKDVDAAGR